MVAIRNNTTSYIFLLHSLVLPTNTRLLFLLMAKKNTRTRKSSGRHRRGGGKNSWTLRPLRSKILKTLRANPVATGLAAAAAAAATAAYVTGHIPSSTDSTRNTHEREVAVAMNGTGRHHGKGKRGDGRVLKAKEAVEKKTPAKAKEAVDALVTQDRLKTILKILNDIKTGTNSDIQMYNECECNRLICESKRLQLILERNSIPDSQTKQSFDKLNTEFTQYTARWKSTKSYKDVWKLSLIPYYQTVGRSVLVV